MIDKKLTEARDKAAAYAMALDRDIATERFQQVRSGKLWSGWVGTIFGFMVATEAGYAFDTRVEAQANAELFREQCREIVRKSTPPC